MRSKFELPAPKSSSAIRQPISRKKATADSTGRVAHGFLQYLDDHQMSGEIQLGELVAEGAAGRCMASLKEDFRRHVQEQPVVAVTLVLKIVQMQQVAQPSSDFLCVGLNCPNSSGGATGALAVSQVRSSASKPIAVASTGCESTGNGCAAYVARSGHRRRFP